MSATWLLCENEDSCPPATMHAYPEVGDIVEVDTATEGRIAGEVEDYVALAVGVELEVTDVSPDSHQIIGRRADGSTVERLFVNLDDLDGYTDE